MQVESTNKEDTGIDLLKFIAAMLVVSSHTGVFSTWDTIFDLHFINIVFRWCVPFFFICSGFYLHDKLNLVIRYEARLIILYVIWTMFYAYINNIHISLDNIMGILRGGIIAPFWYFPSLICGTLFVFFITRFLPDKVSFCIVLSLYIIGLFGDGYAYIMPLGGWYQMTIGKVNAMLFGYTSRNGLMFCSLFIWIGKMIKKHKGIIIGLVKKIPSFYFCVSLIISWLLLALEVHLYIRYGLGVDANLLISIVPLAILIFFLGFRIEIINAEAGKIMRGCSTIVYVIHCYYIERFININESSLIRFLLIYSASLLTALVIVIIGKRIKILRYIY